MTKLKIAIRDSGYRQNYVAKCIGVNETLLSHYVRGDREPPQEVVRAIAELLGVTQKSLVG